jgi:hypothetical protein
METRVQIQITPKIIKKHKKAIKLETTLASHLHHLGVDFALTDFVTSFEDSSVI